MNYSWKIAGISLLAAISAPVLLNIEVIAFTEHIWATNETYTHGFLIFPISAWLIWRKRNVLAALAPEPDWLGFAPLLLICLIWQLGHQADVMVVQQYCLVGMIAASAWILLGKKVFHQVSFPVFFLFLAVPIGESLIPALMNFTADFTVSALQLTGIPVYKEGTFFSLPGTSWSVIDACSGLRYLISSLTLGILYAYLTYRSLARKLVFIAFSAVVPIFANGIRAYMIVMIGQFVGLRYAAGIDHLIYGWVFFGLVMLLLFWIGSFFREQDDHREAGKIAAIEAHQKPAAAFAAFAAIIVAILGLSGSYASYLDKKIQNNSAVELIIPEIPGWNGSSSIEWTPHYLGSRKTIAVRYIRKTAEAGLFIAYYRNQHQGKELVTSGNMLVTIRDPVWGEIGGGTVSVGSGTEILRIRQAMLKSGNRHLLAWRWYWIHGKWTSNPYMAKFLEAESRILHGSDDAAVIVVYSPYLTRPEEASAVLQDFLVQSLPEIKKMLENAAK